MNFDTKLDAVLRHLVEDNQEVTDPALAQEIHALQTSRQTGQQSKTQVGAQQQREKQEQDKKNKRAQELGKQINIVDKDLLQSQGKIAGGVSKPADVNKVSQLLTAKRPLEKELMRTFGVPSQ